MLSYELLDEILERISSMTSMKPEPENVVFIGYDLPNRDKHSILQKLRKDGFIDSMLSKQGVNLYPDGMPLYFITFDGLLMLQEENGYTGRREKLIKKEQRLEESINSRDITQKVISRGTMFAAIFSGLYLVLTFAVFYKSNFSLSESKAEPSSPKKETQKLIPDTLQLHKTSKRQDSSHISAP